MHHEPALDAGGFARLDTSDLLDVDELSDEDTLCNWCAEEPIGANDYRVIADNQYFQVCPICWGRSAEYVALRREGVAHEAARNRVLSAA